MGVKGLTPLFILLNISFENLELHQFSLASSIPFVILVASLLKAVSKSNMHDTNKVMSEITTTRQRSF